ncbi:unnamed protein product, partial [Ectocarpus fasciculatus]
LVGRVFGGLPNGRLGRPSIKAGGRSTGFPAVRVDPVTEPSTPSSSSPDLRNFTAFSRSEGAASRGQEAAAWAGISNRQRSSSGRRDRETEQQIDLADSAAWLFVVGPVLGEGERAGVSGGGGGAGGGAAVVLDAPVPVPVAVDNTVGARCNGGSGGIGGHGDEDAAAATMTNGPTAWFRSARSPSPETGRMFRTMRAVSAALSSLVCPCFQRMHDDDDDDDDGQSERE